MLRLQLEKISNPEGYLSTLTPHSTLPSRLHLEMIFVSLEQLGTQDLYFSCIRLDLEIETSLMGGSNS